MPNEINRAEACHAAIGDACAWLCLTPAEFFAAARQWTTLGPALWAETDPETFYTAWLGEAGRSGICANIIDQFSRTEIFFLLEAIFDQFPIGFYLDYGCGTAAVSWPFLSRATSAVLVDVPNLSQQFVQWRVEQAGLRDVAVLPPEAAGSLPDGLMDLVVCVDVLEHLPNPTAIFLQLDRLVKPGGLLLHRSPWAREDEDLGEHLQEATADWHRPGGGAQLVGALYEVVQPVAFGGLYRKK